MATVGDQLVTPESGWRRYDDTHVGLKYTGTWTTPSPSNIGYYGGSIRVTSRAVDNNYVTFSFFGTKLRIISDLYSDRHSDNAITIDGVTEMYSAFRAVGSPSLQQSIVYEKTGLPLAFHTVTITTGHNRINFTLDAIDIDETGYLYGHALTSPETGWKRYDDTHDAFVYHGDNWIFQTQTGTPTLYNATHHYFAKGMGGNEIRFKFYGTKLRLISSIGSTFADDISVVIDGATEKFNSKMATTIDERQRLTYEKTNLPLGVHEVKLISGTNGDWRLDIDAIDIDDNGQLLASVGSRLTAPEAGWKRYDDSVSSIKYVGRFTNGVGAGAYNGYSNYTSTIGDKIVFDFEGTKLRLIGARYTNRSDLIEVYVDGKLHGTHSQLGSELAQVLQVEIVGLPKSRHRVEMVNKSSGSTTTFMALDAVDIDSDGRLFHPDEVTSITELEVGKRIRCNYVSNTAGVAGEFKNIGKQTSDFISTTSVPSVPNGDFYFIVADAYNGKKILIADRNIQSTIAWDALNSSGLVFGVQKELGEKNYTFLYRLLRGGINATDKDNEWDKYIVSSTLNGAIIAGSNGVWNWSGTTRSWTSTTYPSFTDRRVQRGGTSADAFIANNNGSIATNTSSTATGYRPLVELETLPMFKSFVKHDGAYKRLDTVTLEWNTISATLPPEDTFINDGMDDLSVLDRKNESFVQTMTANGSLGSGKLFKERSDLKKYFEITSVSVK